MGKYECICGGKSFHLSKGKITCTNPDCRKQFRLGIESAETFSRNRFEIVDQFNEALRK